MAFNTLINGKFTNPGQPAFQYYLGTNVDNATGTGTSYALGSTQALTQVFDNLGNMSTAGVFTAPVAGIYVFQASALLLNISTPIWGNIQFVSSGGAYFNRYISAIAGNSSFQVFGSCLFELTASETVVFNVQSFGEISDSETIQGAYANTCISGYLVC